ncbi:host specificity factor TipJ family phage tail protein [Ancylobacter mangrovi]|uniref:host specificity factor TipJ family phage tail protein n=1 Tax=Ancylobacter mangrovi TaxID=2972472 RepID=UPI002161DAA7|nr:host specificity factor TipJ family phage tail protein [Ancylobacter mangrovi]MCS0501373.1 host specificity factor TipJ family phage tail protein [Ancylobacter mangrovi]
MTATRQPVPAVHLLLPGRELARAEPRRRETIAALIRRAELRFETFPTICVIDGAPVLRAEWTTRRIRAGEQVVFLSRPRGGSGGTRQLLGLLGVIALSALAPGIGTAVSGALFGGSAAMASIVGAAFVAGGALALNSLVTPKPAQSLDAAQTLYSFNQQSNSARVLQTIPAGYGRIKTVPDYAAVPWSMFDGNDQYMHLLLAIGVGRYRREQILINDTVLWDWQSGVNPAFTGVQIQHCEPGEAMTLFPAGVETAAEVSGQELSDPSTWVGGFVANAAGTVTTKLAFDFVFSQGLFNMDAEGNMSARSLGVEVQVRSVDGTGAPIGGWTTIAAPVWTFRSQTPQRVTHEQAVDAGRYEARVRRTTETATNGRDADTILWQGLRAFIGGPQSFEGVSVTALRLKATDQLSADALQQVSVIATRILPVWTGSGWEEQPTRSPSWAALDIATDGVYGAGRPLSKIDLQAFADLDALAASRSDCFDYSFRDAVGVPDALDTALRVARAKHRWIGDVLSLIRDQWRDTPSMLLSDREIVRGSISIDYQLAAEDSADGVVLNYLDESTWQPAQVQCPRDVELLRPATIELPGIVRREQAQRETDFYWRANLYRRVRPTCTTEHDGRLLAFGSNVLMQSELPRSWGQSGALAARLGVRLTLSPVPDWGSGQHYLGVRTRRGKLWGPVKVSRGVEDRYALLDPADLAAVEAAQAMTLDAAMARGDGDEPASFVFGAGTGWQKRCLVVTGRPSGDQVELQLVVDDPRVHDEDLTSPPPLPDGPSQVIPPYPVVGGLVARMRQNVMETILEASWWPAAGAAAYAAQVSYDEGASWTQLAETRAPQISSVVAPIDLRLRVAGIGTRQGPWVAVDVTAPTLDQSQITVTQAMFEAGVRDYVFREIAEGQAQVEAINERMAQITADLAAGAYLDQQKMQRELTSKVGGAIATFREEILVATGPDSALAQAITTLEAEVENVNASLNVRWVAAAGPSGALASYGVEAKVADDFASAAGGMWIDAMTDGAGGAFSQVRFLGNRLLVGSSDGGTFVPMFSVNTSTGEVYVNGNLIANGSITALKLAVGYLSAISANIGEIIAGLLRSSDNRLRVDLNNARIEIWS